MRQHPLEPLSADEFRQTASILRREGLVRDTFRFASIELKEPPKGEAWSPGDAVRRTSFAVVFNREDNKTYEATVDLTGHAVVSFEHVPDVTPNFTLDEFHDVDVAMRQHPDVIAKLAARGFTDMSLILVDVWTYGKAVMPEQHRQRRLGFNYREGPVIYQVTFDDRGTVRDIAYRLSFAEMIVPYRDPTFDHYRRTAYDIGEWGLGVMTKSLELGCDCLGEVTYLDATLCDSKGDPYDIPHAICLHEEDNAVLWKHVDPHTGAEIRRQRRMVVSCHASVANYEYLIYWRFYQDGNIECEVRATGLMVTTPYPEGGQPPIHRRHRHQRVDQGRRIAREHRRGPLVRLRPPPHHSHGGVAGHARRCGVVLAQALGLLQPEPLPGRGANGAGRGRHLPYVTAAHAECSRRRRCTGTAYDGPGAGFIDELPGGSPLGIRRRPALAGRCAARSRRPPGSPTGRYGADR